jgi:hypothetical protein
LLSLEKRGPEGPRFDLAGQVFLFLADRTFSSEKRAMSEIGQRFFLTLLLHRI